MKHPLVNHTKCYVDKPSEFVRNYNILNSSGHRIGFIFGAVNLWNVPQLVFGTEIVKWSKDPLA